MASTISSKVLLALAAFMLCIAMRAPFLAQPLAGEEGMFAALVTGYKAPQVASLIPAFAEKIDQHCLLLIAHIDVAGDIVMRPSRNIAPYCFLGFVVKPAVGFFDLASLDFDQKSTLIRSVFLVLSGIGVLSLCILSLLIAFSLSGFQATAPFLVLLAFTAAPLAVGASIQPQLDGAFGFLLLSNVVLLVYLGSKKSIFPPYQFAFNFLGGFLIAFCKNEWPLTLLASVIGVFSLQFFCRLLKLRSLGPQPRLLDATYLTIGVALVIGCLVGMATCYWFSPGDYVSGFDLMKNINGSQVSHLKILFKSLYFNFEILAPLLVALFAGAWCVYINRYELLGPQIGLLILYFWSWGVMVGFLQSGWGGDGFPRYFLPSLLVAGAFIITQLPSLFLHSKNNFIIPVFIITAVIMAAFNYDRLINKYTAGESITVPGNYIETKNSLIGAAATGRRDPFGVLAHKTALSLYFPGTNFIATDIGMDGVKNWPLPSSKYYIVM